MERYLALTLLQLRDDYMRHVDIAEATLGKHVVGDWQLFSKLSDARDGEGPLAQTFTVAKFDRAMDWFHSNWPEGAAVPFQMTDWRGVKQWEASNNWSCAPEDWPRLLVQAGLREAQEDAA